MLTPPRRILILYCSDGSGGLRPSMQHHLHALEASPVPHRLVYHDVIDGTPTWLGRFSCDAVILHTTLLSMRWNHLFRHLRHELCWLSPLSCPKIALAQDEYDHSEVLDEWLAELGVSVICTTLDEPHWRLLYPTMHDKALFARCLTGYIDDRTAQRCAPKLLPTTARRVDIVYRAYQPLYWYGSHGQLKHRVARLVAARAAERGLHCDISTRDEDAILGDRWFTFLASAKATIGCETGSSVLDRRGEIRRHIQFLLRGTPGLSFDEIHAQMPAGWDDHRFCAIGPRHFEAIITKTCQILLEGAYDGILEPHRHYIPLKRDFSNLDDVLDKVQDDALLEEIASRAYAEIYLSGKYSYAALASRIEHGIAAAVTPDPTASGPRPMVFWRGLPAALGLWDRWHAAAFRAKKLLACTRICLSDGVAREYLYRCMGARWNMRRVPLGQALREAVRIGVLVRALEAGGRGGSGFDLTVRFEPGTGRLALLSVPREGSGPPLAGQDLGGQPWPPTGADWPGLEAAFCEGRVGEVVWDHWPVGKTVPFPGPAARHLDFFLGEEGIYRLEGLRQIGRKDPGMAVGLLKSMVASPER